MFNGVAMMLAYRNGNSADNKGSEKASGQTESHRRFWI